MLNPNSIKPSEGYVLIFKEFPKKETKKGIILSDSLQKEEKEFPVYSVVASGGYKYPNGSVVILSPIVNQMPVFGFDDEFGSYFLISKDLIIGVIE